MRTTLHSDPARLEASGRAPCARRLAWLLGAGISLAGATGWATTLVDTPNGTPVEGYTARSTAMGATGAAVYQGSAALVQNPAALASADSTWRFDLVLGLYHTTEDRFIPLFDSFEAFVDETAIAVNRKTYADAQGGVVYRLPGRAMSVGLGLFERYDFEYAYFQEFRNPDGLTSPIRDAVLELREFDVQGRLRALTGGYGAELGSYRGVTASGGLSVHRYFGTIEQHRRATTVTLPDPPPADPTLAKAENLTHELTGWGFSVGALVRSDQRVDLAVAYEHGFTVDGSRQTDSTLVRESETSVVSAQSEDELEYPGVLRFGLAYHPRNELRTTLAIEAVRSFWSNVDTGDRHALVLDDAVEAGLRDTWDVRLGLEHVFYNGSPARLGFRYLENYADRESARSVFSAGVGFPVAGFLLDVTGQYHRQTSRQPLDILFDPTSTLNGGPFVGSSSNAKVEDSVVRVVLGFSRSF